MPTALRQTAIMVSWFVFLGANFLTLVLVASYVSSLFQTTANDGHAITNEERGMGLAVTLVFGGVGIAIAAVSAFVLWLLSRNLVRKNNEL